MTCAKMMAATATATLTAGMRRPRAAGRIDAGMMRCFLQTLAYGWPRPFGREACAANVFTPRGKRFGGEAARGQKLGRCRSP